MRRAFIPLVLVAVVTLAACQPGEEAGPPADWETIGTERWWHAEADTAVAFRDMDSFEELALSDREDGLLDDGPVVRNVQRRFLALYRNHPEVVDSLFRQLAVPIIERDAEPGALDAEREALVSQINRRIHQAFFPAQPRQADRPPIVIPDSLRQQGITGTVALQIYLDNEGRPRGIRKLEGIHESMDAIVMRNYAQRTWQPAHLDGNPIASWTRASVNIGE